MLGTIKKLNDAIAIRATLAMSTMWCVYAFFLLSLLPLISKDLETVVIYISSAIIQLVALPLIMVGQQKLSEAGEKRAADDHNTLIEELADVRLLLDEHKEELAKLDEIIVLLKSST